MGWKKSRTKWKEGWGKGQMSKFKVQTKKYNVKFQSSPSPCALPCKTVSQCQNTTFGKGERRSGEKDVERQPLTVWIQVCQPQEDIRLLAYDSSPYLKNPRSKTLEPDCLSP